MSSKFVRSLFISAIITLPLPLILPFALGAVSGNSAFSEVLSGASSLSYYLTTWLLSLVAALLAAALGNKQSGTSKTSGASRQARSKSTSDSAGPEGNDRGSVKWFNVNKGFGFITTESGDDIFVHFRSIRGSGRRSLRQGQKVRFDVSEGDKGLQADNVSVIND